MTSLSALALTIVCIVLTPALSIALCRLALRTIDDRGLYAVSPFLGLPIVAGGLLEGYMLASTDLVRLLAPTALWSDGEWWHLSLRGLYAAYLAPSALLGLVGITLGVAQASWPAAWPWAMAYGLAFAPVAVMSGLAWRSWRAVPAAFLFLPLSLAAAITIHYSIFITCWSVYWINFWIFFIFVSLIEMRRHDRAPGQLLAP